MHNSEHSDILKLLGPLAINLGSLLEQHLDSPNYS